ncbi:MAG: hypothetical protein K0R38_1660 [Polyangiaceae bacterium]|jgi:hypothetical protein|nr:hypothetical protein [Polyangiaceae bacterium]
MRRLLFAGVVTGAVYAGCTSDSGSSPPLSNEGASGAEAESGAHAGGWSGNDAQGGHDSEAAGAAGVASVGGNGLGGGSGDGASGAAGSGHVDEGAGEGGASGGAAGAGSSAGGEQEQPELPLNGCLEFVDARAPGALREIAWDYGTGGDPRRCLLIQQGQSVTWQGPFSTHPIQAAGGSMPSPIIGDTLSDATSYQVTFGALGDFGYVCGLHTSMRGAIRVVE